MTDTGEQSQEVPTESAGTVKEVARSAQEQAGAVASEARQQAGAVTSEAKAQAMNLAHDAKHQLREQAEAQTAKVSESLQRLTTELRALCEGRPDEAGTVRQYAEQASTQLNRLTSRLDERSLDGLVDDLQRFARRRPGMFLAGAAATGFLAGRMFRSIKDEQQEQGSTGVGSAGYQSSAMPMPPARPSEAA
jgi:uncharacterized phage infection (PIP) family protein YhgE